jgi:hypothetical protein
MNTKMPTPVTASLFSPNTSSPRRKLLRGLPAGSIPDWAATVPGCGVTVPGCGVTVTGSGVAVVGSVTVADPGDVYVLPMNRG